MYTNFYAILPEGEGFTGALGVSSNGSSSVTAAAELAAAEGWANAPILRIERSGGANFPGERPGRYLYRESYATPRTIGRWPDGRPMVEWSYRTIREVR